jgi:LPXTG-motif cell wall-anchored protein
VQYQALDADRSQALNVSLLTPDAASATAPPTEAPGAATIEDRPVGAASTGTPVSLMGLAIVGVAAVGVVAWVFTRRRREQETPHFSL